MGLDSEGRVCDLTPLPTMWQASVESTAVLTSRCHRVALLRFSPPALPSVGVLKDVGAFSVLSYPQEATGVQRTAAGAGRQGQRRVQQHWIDHPNLYTSLTCS